MFQFFTIKQTPQQVHIINIENAEKPISLPSVCIVDKENGQISGYSSAKEIVSETTDLVMRWSSKIPEGETVISVASYDSIDKVAALALVKGDRFF